MSLNDLLTWERVESQGLNLKLFSLFPEKISLTNVALRERRNFLKFSKASPSKEFFVPFQLQFLVAAKYEL